MLFDCLSFGLATQHIVQRLLFFRLHDSWTVSGEGPLSVVVFLHQYHDRDQILFPIPAISISQDVLVATLRLVDSVLYKRGEVVDRSARDQLFSPFHGTQDRQSNTDERWNSSWLSIWWHSHKIRWPDFHLLILSHKITDFCSKTEGWILIGSKHSSNFDNSKSQYWRHFHTKIKLSSIYSNQHQESAFKLKHQQLRCHIHRFYSLQSDRLEEIIYKA